MNFKDLKEIFDLMIIERPEAISIATEYQIHLLEKILIALGGSLDE